MKKLKLIFALCLVYICILKVINTTEVEPSKQSIEDNLNDKNTNEEIVFEPKKPEKLYELKDGPIKIEIVGDTSHLFAEEDFQKKEAILLGNGDIKAKSEADEKVQAEENSVNNKTTVLKRKNSSANQHPDCLNINLNMSRENISVELVNGSYLTRQLSDADADRCFLVLFYVPWCPYSTRLAPIYNALPKAFPNLDIFGFDVSKSIGYNTKFGTSAVPMILLFQNKNVIARFNYTGKNLTDYIEFISKNTGLNGNSSITIDENDLLGPVPTVPIKTFDYFLLFSWIFIIFVSCELVVRKTKLKIYLASLINFLIGILRPNKKLELQQPSTIPMIQQNENTNHLHND